MPSPSPLKITALLALGGWAFTGCSREDAPGNIPPSPEAHYSRAVAYLDQARPARHDTTHRSPALQVSGQLSSTECVIRLRPASNQEGLVFRIPRAQMPADLAGRYSFRAPVNPGQAPTYQYWANSPDVPAGGHATIYESWWLPSTGAVTGALTLTAYNAKHHLLSGQFQLALTGVYDPRALSTAFGSRPCDLTLTGTFTNAPVADTQ